MHSTQWSLIHGARAGEKGAREALAETYVPFVRAYFRARWVGTPRAQEVEDATQEVFLDMLRGRGALERLESGRPGGFRAFLCGVARNVALRVECPRRRPTPSEPAALTQLAAEQESAAAVLDREWARALLREAAERMRAEAARRGGLALRRAELLALRFRDELPVRRIAAQWGVEADWVHHQYAKARRVYQRHLERVVAEHEGTSLETARVRCGELLGLLH